MYKTQQCCSLPLHFSFEVFLSTPGIDCSNVVNVLMIHSINKFLIVRMVAKMANFSADEYFMDIGYTSITMIQGASCLCSFVVATINETF